MTSQSQGPIISLMLAVPDTPAAVEWYKRALGARVLWSLGSVAGMELEGTPFFLAEPSRNAWNSPGDIGTTTVRVELFCNDPDAMINALWKRAQPEVSPISRITKGHGEPIGRVRSPIPLGISGLSATSLLYPLSLLNEVSKRPYRADHKQVDLQNCSSDFSRLERTRNYFEIS